MRGILSTATTLIIFLSVCILLWRQRTRNLSHVPAQLDSYWDALKERRKFRRFKMKLPVECRVPDKSDNIYHTFSKDISGEGICLQVPELMPEGSVLDMMVKMPQGRPLHVRGEIAWVSESPKKSDSDERSFMAGIKFVKVDPDDKKRLSSFLDDAVKSNID